MNLDPPCYLGILPKARKVLIGSHLDYYIEGTDRQMASGRSTEHAALIVKAAGECEKDKLVAPLSSAGPAAVFPAMPAGMTAGGVGALPFVLGGLAAGGGAAAIISQGGDNTPTTPTPPPTTGVPPPPPPVIPTPPPPVTPLDPLLVTCGAEPQSGPAPLGVYFWVYPGGGTGNYDYLWEFGDGDTSGNKNLTHWYMSSGAFTAKVTLSDGKSSVACYKNIEVLKGRGAAGAIPDMPNVMVFDSRLEAGAAKGTLAVDGAVAASLDASGPRSASAARRDTHHVEAWVTDSGSAGVWRFELGRAGVVPGSLNILQGDVTLVTPEAVVFRVAGRAGERLAFTFRTQ